MNLRKLTMALSLLLIAVMVGCGGEDKNMTGQSGVKVNTIKVTAMQVPDVIEYPGNVEGLQRVKLSTKLMGTIDYLPKDAGARITKGETLVKINSADVVAKKQQVLSQIAQAEAAYNNTKINYERVESLYEKGSATKKEMEDVTMGYKMAKAQYEAAKEMENEIADVLSYANIKAPFSGYIVNKFFEEGDLSAPGHPILIVENFGGFKVRAEVSASDINRLNTGENVKIKIDELDGRVLNGEIVEINPGAHPASRQFEIQVKINDDNTHGLKSGMYAKVLLPDTDRKLVAVADEHIVTRGQLTGVYTVNSSNETVLRWLRLGKDVNGKREVLSGLSEGDMIIADIEKVREGQKVEVAR